MTASPAPTREELLVDGIDLFKNVFKGQAPTYAACAPGRVNLIGEHTDYNDGYVFPMALPNVVLIVGSPNNSKEITVYSNSVHDTDRKITFPVPSVQPLQRGLPGWGNYVKGVVNFFKAAEVPGFNAVILTSVPVGAGVSSSAALEVATFTFLEALTGTKVDKKEKALTCQKAEHIFAEMPCGIMDQFISIHGQKGHALLLDCQNMQYEQIPFDDPNVCVLITNSNVKHQLDGSEYPTRARQCREAAAILGVSSLREASSHDLEKHKDKMTGEIYRRARHVISEISRTSEAASALRMKDYSSFGMLMLQSHNSLKDDYEVSCPELDELVDIAINTKGVYGSRLTGAGFGGSTITLVSVEAVQDLMQALMRSSLKHKPSFMIARPSAGPENLTPQLSQILNRRASSNQRTISTQTKSLVK